ncbi:MAG: transporter substrate-binding domain-containing protein [Eubacteriales bacterium]
MKKLLALFLLLSVTLTGLISCGGKKSDDQAIKDKGYFVCGITYYAPMNYFDDDSNLVGFDTEFAQAVADYLELEVKFQIIDWGSKFLELNSGSIDAIWNGFTIDDERRQEVDFSYSYMNNSQCIVVKAANLDTYTGTASLEGKRAVAETGSAGETIVQGMNASEEVVTYTGVSAQTTALMEVQAGTADFAVIDVLMAQSMVGSGDFADLALVSAIQLTPEEYGIGFRKGSDFTARVNEAIAALSADGTLDTIAAKYGVSNALIPDIGE